ncbi:MAG: caspase family protein [Chitinophagaceae bacterium]
MKKISLLVISYFFLTRGMAQQLETVIQRSGGGHCTEFTISTDGLLLAKINNNVSLSEIEIWNTKTGLLQHVISTNRTSKGAEFFLNSVKHARFWKGSKFIVTGSNDGWHEIYDVATGNLVKRLKIRSYLDGIFAICEKTGTLTVIPPLSLARSQLYFFDLYSGTLYDSVALDLDGSITAMEFSPAGDKIAIGTTEGSFHILERATFNRTIRADSVLTGDVEFIQWTNDNYLLVSGKDKYLVFNLKNAQLVSDEKLEQGTRMIVSPTEDCYYFAGKKNIIKRTGRGLVQKKMGIEPDSICRFQMDPEYKRLYILTENFIRVWDMKNILQTESKKVAVYAPIIGERNHDKLPLHLFRFIPSLHSGIYQEGDRLIQQPIDSSAPMQNYSLGAGKLTSIVIGNDGFVAASLEGRIKTWKAGKLTEFNTLHNDSLLFIFPGMDKLAAVSAQDSVLKIYDIATGTLQQILLSPVLSCGAFSPDKKQFAVAGNKLYIINAATLKPQRLYDAKKEDFIFEYDEQRLSTETPGFYKQVCFSKDGQHLFAINGFGQLKVWNLKTFKIDTILNMGATQVQLTSEKDRILISSQNQITFYNTKTFQEDAHIAFLAKGDFVVSLADNYYRSSRNGAKAVAFRKGLQSMGFDQFDILYNRPDKVVQAIGDPDDKVLESLQKAVTKRRVKLGFAQFTDNLNSLDAPDLSIKDYNRLPTNTKNPDFYFQATAKDKKYPIVSYQGFINGVPFGSKTGYSLVSLGTPEERKTINFNITLALDAGKNLVEIVCTNEKGIESTKISFEIFYEAPVIVKPVLYFIGIGAGTYKNTEYNLKYPSKDIADVSKLFQARTDLYEKVNVTLLLDEQVNRKEIFNLKKILLGTNIRDQVVIYWSGHGVLNKELDYYLATYPMDFANPVDAGLEYMDLENLLDSIPARQKILFIDACHSGELDKEGTSLVTDNSRTTDGIISKGLKVRVEANTSVTTYALLNELFADTRRSSGANIISAAGGAEYALESDRWANGVFTYSLLEGLSEKKADLNKDGEIMISELQNYLQERVPELTKGRQKPTSRSENLVKDWRIW